MINCQELTKILKANKVDATCVASNQHRHFAYYDLVLEPGVLISRIQRRSREIALGMKAHSYLIVNPIPKKGIVRLQTTISDPEVLQFNDLYRSTSAPQDYFLPFLLGETDEGKPLWTDMAKNPHLLCAGATGAGKSVLLHTLIHNAAMRNDVRLYLVDTKRVEFSVYQDQLSTVAGVSNTYDEALSVLDFLNFLMEERYKYMASIGAQSIEDCPNDLDKIVLIIDEAADLMLYEKSKTFENLVAKLAQKARAAGIYMIFATQRPSVDVFTGLIKANFPARLACKVTSKVDSKVILDQQGAENLVGRGDAILNNSQFGMTRLQVAYTEPSHIIRR